MCCEGRLAWWTVQKGHDEGHFPWIVKFSQACISLQFANFVFGDFVIICRCISSRWFWQIYSNAAQQKLQPQRPGNEARFASHFAVLKSSSVIRNIQLIQLIRSRQWSFRRRKVFWSMRGRELEVKSHFGKFETKMVKKVCNVQGYRAGILCQLLWQLDGLSYPSELHKAYSEAIEYCSSPDIVVLCNRSLARMKLEEPQNWLAFNGERMVIGWLNVDLIVYWFTDLHVIWYDILWNQTNCTQYIQNPDKHLCKDTEGALTDAQWAVAKASRCSGPAMLAKVWWVQLNLS